MFTNMSAKNGGPYPPPLPLVRMAEAETYDFIHSLPRCSLALHFAHTTLKINYIFLSCD